MPAGGTGNSGDAHQEMMRLTLHIVGKQRCFDADVDRGSHDVGKSLDLLGWSMARISVARFLSSHWLPTPQIWRVKREVAKSKKSYTALAQLALRAAMRLLLSCSRGQTNDGSKMRTGTARRNY